MRRARRALRVTFLDPLSKAFLFAAAVLAWLVTRRRPEHSFVAAALSLAFALDLVRHFSSDELSEKLYPAYPFISAWCALRVLGRVEAATVGLCVAMLPLTGLSPLAAGLAMQAFAAVLFLLSGRDVDLSDKCCVVLFAGDVAACLGPLLWGGPWWLVQGQALLVSLLLGLIQLRSLQVADERLGDQHALDDD